MSVNTFNKSTLSIPRSRKMVGVIVGVCILVVILAPVIAYLSERPNFSRFVTYLNVGSTLD